jgi:hypothetical protein
MKFALFISTVLATFNYLVLAENKVIIAIKESSIFKESFLKLKIPDLKKPGNCTTKKCTKLIHDKEFKCETLNASKFAFEMIDSIISIKLEKNHKVKRYKLDTQNIEAIKNLEKKLKTNCFFKEEMSPFILLTPVQKGEQFKVIKGKITLEGDGDSLLFRYNYYEFVDDKFYRVNGEMMCNILRKEECYYLSEFEMDYLILWLNEIKAKTR